MHRRSFFQTAGICGLALAVPSVANAADTPISLGFANATQDPEEQLRTIVGRLDALPAELKKADPKSYPDYEKKLRAHLGDLKAVSVPQTEPAVYGSVMMMNPIKCAASVVSIVIKLGTSVVQIIKWIVASFKKYGGIKGVWNALISGQLLKDFGKEAADALKAILGIKDVVEACI
ncbi:hypothetical protein [Devriesea agamarum]|uniref:hypothetical protein n=1 Tax=Devriesea agamarum TaxID=472569 RepID=UPI00071D19C4|nr:hypothetical protein [Devriesea agamarum]